MGVLLVFILRECETLLERIVRVAAQSGAARTIRALGDAAEGISHRFLSLSAVNSGFGASIGPAHARVPHAFPWGALSDMLSIVPDIFDHAASYRPDLLSRSRSLPECLWDDTLSQQRLQLLHVRLGRFPRVGSDS